MNNRKLAHLFLALPYVTRTSIAIKLGLFKNEEHSRGLNEPELSQIIFRRAKEKGVVDELIKEVENCQPKEEKIEMSESNESNESKGMFTPKPDEDDRINPWEFPLISYRIVFKKGDNRIVKCHTINNTSKNENLFKFFVYKEYKRGTVINPQYNISPSRVILRKWIWEAVFFINLSPGDYIEQVSADTKEKSK